MIKDKELANVTVTGFQDIFSKEPHYTTLSKSLSRIRDGSSKDKVERIRSITDSDRQDELKLSLPAILFSGKFGSDRTDQSLEEHSGFIVLDWDDIFHLEDFKAEICCNEYIYAAWISPSNNGIKALIRILDKTKHREHFASIKEMFPEVDKSGINESRVCFESYDPELYINENAKIYEKVIIQELSTNELSHTEVLEDNTSIFKNILRWLENRNDAFVTGERNLFIFKLASACCRFGIPQDEAGYLIASEFGYDSSFTRKEADSAVKSAYKANRNKAGDSKFEKDILVDKKTNIEITLDADFYDKNIKPKDVIYGEFVKDKALNIYDVGHESVAGIGVEEIDYHFKMKRSELTLLTGVGGYGKSTILMWMMLMRSIKFGDKWAIFSPEVNPSEEFYFELVEILLGTDCTPQGTNRPDKDTFKKAYDFIGEHFFYVYPETLSPTPEYIKERFLELIIKERVAGCIIDPVNMLANDYAKFNGRDDRFFETFLSDLIRFAQQNAIYMLYVAHPTKLQLGEDGNFPCPNVYNVAGGAMHNNKCANVLAYHRPKARTEPENPTCEFHAMKIRKQKIVGKTGTSIFEYDWRKRRFIFKGNTDPMIEAIRESSTLSFLHEKSGSAIKQSSFFNDDSDNDNPF